MSHYAPLIATLIALALIAGMLFSKIGSKIQDIPNERSLHSSPIPRIGGIGLMAGALTTWLLLPTHPAWWILLPVLILFGISLLDDMRGLPVKWRFLSHFIAAILMVAGSGLAMQQGSIVSIFLVLLIVWVTNLYNFMDGSDGLAGGMALFGFGCYGIAAWAQGADDFALMNFTLSAASLGFLLFNFHPARVFMGDAGSIPLGFLAATLGIHGWQSQLWQPWFPVLVFSPFIVDSTATLTKRILRGAKITEAHREHYYQRAIQLGLGHRNVSLAEYVLMLIAGLSALNTLHDVFPGVLLLAWCAVYLCLMLLLEARWKAFKRGNNG